jgi:predicted amidohydrolase YtcJ
MAARLTTFLVVGIVAATLIAGLIVGAQRSDTEGPVDVIVHNATVYTADNGGTMAEAVAIRGNQILRVGSEREITRLQRPQTTMIDARGGTVLPGFNDAHVRLLEGAMALGQADLAGAATLSEIQARLEAWSDANPDAEWVIGHGWSQSATGLTAPTRHLLDAAVDDRPVQVLSTTGDAWVNTAALAEAGITRRTTSPAGGAVVKDARTGEPTGLLTGSAVGLVGSVLPRPDRDDRLRALRAAIKEAHRLGITSVQDIGASPADIALYAQLRKDDELDLRIYAALGLEGPVEEGALRRIEAVWREFPDDARLKTGAVVMDLAAAETDDEPAPGPDDFNRFVRLLDAQGWQVMTTARRDQGVRMALNAYRHAARSNPSPQRGRRHRIEGATMAEDTDVPRFGVLGTLASLQPAGDDPESVSLLDDFAARNTRLAFGSGWPAAPLDPMAGLASAVTRAEPIELTAAISAYTSGGAYASFDDKRKGAIAAGMLADLVVLSHDIFDTPAPRVAAASVAVTIFDGKVVYRKAARGSD